MVRAPRPRRDAIDPNDPDDGDLVNHVPDELCVVVQAGGVSDAAALYEEVRAALNQHLAQQIPATQRQQLARLGLDDAFAEDLEPTELTRTLDGGAELLRPLARSGLARPWVQVGDAWHLYFQVGTDRIGFDADSTPERRSRLTRIRELSNLLNLPSVGIGSGTNAGRGRWSVEAGTPNWLTAATPFSCGSPAALPTPADQSGRWRVKFGSRVTQALSDAARGRKPEVVVAVLDTCPDASSLSDRGNPHLAALLERLRISDELGLQRDYFAPPADVPVYWNACVPWWHEAMPPSVADDTFSIPDHGVFVAGLVNDVAPDVELHLMRVLNDRGVGDLLGLDQVLRSLPSRLLEGHRSRRLIVNLSLGTAIPLPRQRLWRRWLPATRARAGRAAWPDSLSSSMLDAAHRSLWNTIRWLSEQGVLVVAAAGNDALRAHLAGALPPPRYPAYYQSVLAVAAAGPDGAPAVYSNRADVLPLGNGVTTFGGNVVVPDRRDEPPEADPGVAAGGRAQSVVGLYSSPTLPRGEANTTGWVHWAGTSFATAIMSGLAARLWQQDGSQSPTDLIYRIRSLARNVPSRPRRPAGKDPDGPLDAPYLEAWQEFER